MADGYASVAEFVRVYMAAFLEENASGYRPPAGAASRGTAMPRNQGLPALPSHHLPPPAVDV